MTVGTTGIGLDGILALVLIIGVEIFGLSHTEMHGETPGMILFGIHGGVGMHGALDGAGMLDGAGTAGHGMAGAGVQDHFGAHLIMETTGDQYILLIAEGEAEMLLEAHVLPEGPFHREKEDHHQVGAQQ